MSRPAEGEFGAFYRHYIDLASGENIAELLSFHSKEIIDCIERLPEEKADYAYAPGKWTVKQMLQHMLDTERIFIYRLIWIARGDRRPLAGFDENAFAQAAPATHREISDLKAELISLRKSTDLLFADLTPQELCQKGEASGYFVTVNALCFIIIGHLLHHLNVLRDRYFMAV